MVYHDNITHDTDSMLLAQGLIQATRKVQAMTTGHAGSIFVPDKEGKGVLLGSQAGQYNGIAYRDEEGNLSPIVDLSEVNQTLVENTTILNQAKQDVEQANRDLAAAKTAMDENSQAISQARKDITANQQAISQANQALDQAKQDLEAAKRTVSSYSDRIASATMQATQALDKTTSMGKTIDGLHNIYKGPDDPCKKATVKQGDYWYRTQSWAAYWQGSVDESSSALVPMQDIVTAVYEYDGAEWKPFNLVASNILATGTVTTDTLAANSVTTDKLTANSITADKLTSNSVTADKLAANSVTTDKLAAQSVNADKLAANSITADKLTANSITADKLAANSVTASQIRAGAIDGKTITGATIRTSSRGQRTELDSTGLKVMDNADKLMLEVSSQVQNGLSLRNPITDIMTPLSSMVFGSAARYETNLIMNNAKNIREAGWTDWMPFNSFTPFTTPTGRILVINSCGYTGDWNSIYQTCVQCNIDIRTSQGTGGLVASTSPSATAAYTDGYTGSGNSVAMQIFTVALNQTYYIGYALRSSHILKQGQTQSLRAHCDRRSTLIMPV